MHEQLTLQVQLRDEATFANFFSTQNNELVSQLTSQIQSSKHAFYYLWGGRGVGKTHLLLACYYQALRNDLSASYVSLAESTINPAVLEGLDEVSLVCLDDLEYVIGNRSWEEALFHFYNAMREKQHCLIVSALDSPRALQCQLADLQSRLNWGMVYQVQGLSDVEKIVVLQLRANKRGLLLSEECANFLLTRCSRDMSSLSQILERLDIASLRSKRSLSIPFIKMVLEIK